MNSKLENRSVFHNALSKKQQYNPWNNSTNKSQAAEDGCINILNMLNIKQWNKKSKWHQVGLSLFNYGIKN